MTLKREVLYQKWRPKIFSDVVGQDHITLTLKNSLIRDKYAHAYLFTGPRGTGKTSTARILAKALNTDIDPSGEPLLETQISQEIDFLVCLLPALKLLLMSFLIFQENIFRLFHK